jgi:folate-binding protein YgfZ
VSERPPDTFGDVTGEYLALRREAGLVSGHRELLWVAGADAVGFLDGLLSQDVGSAAPGSVVRSFLLEPRGKLHSMLWVLRGEGRVGLLADAGTADDAAAHLERFRFRVDATVRRDERPLVEVWGPDAPAVLEAAGLPAGDGWADSGDATVASIPLGRLPRLAVAAADDGPLVAAGARRAGWLASEAVRIEGGEPRVGVDVDGSTIPHETGLAGSLVSFTKGCYLGQELVARIESRGHVNRLLRGVVLAENLLPPPGAEVVAGDEVAGTLTSVGESLELRAPIGLATVRREVAPGDPVTLRWPGGSARAVLAGLPLDDFSGR